MQPGELSAPFQGRESYFHIVRVEDQRPLPYESIEIGSKTGSTRIALPRKRQSFALTSENSSIYS